MSVTILYCSPPWNKSLNIEKKVRIILYIKSYKLIVLFNHQHFDESKLSNSRLLGCNLHLIII